MEASSKAALLLMVIVGCLTIPAHSRNVVRFCKCQKQTCKKGAIFEAVCYCCPGGPSSHGGPAVGARAAGTQLALQACRVEDVPAAQPGPPHLSRHMSAWDEASAASPSSASCSSETGLGNAVIGTNSSALATAGTTTGSVAAPSSALLAGDGFAGLEATVPYTAPKSVHARRKARSMTDSPRTRVNERRSARGCDRGRGSRLGWKNMTKAGKTNGTSDDAKTMPLRESVSGLVSDEYGEEAPAPTPSAENGVVRRWRHEGREKRSRIANEAVATEARTIIIVAEVMPSHRIGTIGSKSGTPSPFLPHFQGFVEQEGKGIGIHTCSLSDKDAMKTWTSEGDIGNIPLDTYMERACKRRKKPSRNSSKPRGTCTGRQSEKGERMRVPSQP
ncbi:hypothetical protein Zm00014a_017384 [Zea mays]|uniref:Uncharacterized protein n=1 Tax=Zea mays TaxID=4577 RepID=A0A3L6FNT9_MAIZE|nr:hypothetical protein Zm00014a_017384 [Zea mays]